MSAAPEWLTVGADVVEFTPSRFGGNSGGDIVPTTVLRIGKRDVVLANGNRYNVGSLRKKRGAWDPDTYLLPPFDERVIAARQANRLDRLKSQAATAWDAFRREATQKSASELVAAVQAWQQAEAKS